MGFVRDAVGIAASPLAFALSSKKKQVVPTPQPTMISNTPYSQPMSMIGQSRGGF